MTTAYVAGTRRARSRGPVAALPWVLAAAVIGLQVSYPLLAGEALRSVTIATVGTFFLASVAHALVHHGGRWTATLVLVTGGGGLVAEAVGVRTGYPFGGYAYAGTLGPELLDVPVVVPLAWTMMAYPAFVAARRLTRRFVPLVGGLALATWDVFLDPQMVAAGHWTWDHPAPALPGVAGIPLTNYAGWLLVSVAMMTVLHQLLPRHPGADEAQPALLYLWTWAGSVVGNLVFFGRPSVALVGGVAMGVVAVPYAYVRWRDRP